MKEVTRALVEVILILGQDLSLKFNLRGDVVLKSRLFYVYVVIQFSFG